MKKSWEYLNKTKSLTLRIANGDMELLDMYADAIGEMGAPVSRAYVVLELMKLGTSIFEDKFSIKNSATYRRWMKKKLERENQTKETPQ
jgi:hypothetical protein